MPRLRHVKKHELAVSRIRKGRGYAFVDSTGQPVRDPELKARISKLGIPPAWKDVRVATLPNAHIQVLGTDDSGRLQYIYHPDWEIRRARKKQVQLAMLTEALPKLRRRVAEDLTAETGSKTLAVAIAVALIDRTAMRVGRERYLHTNGTRGAGTLYTRDVRVKGDTLWIKFPAKSGKLAEYSIKDQALAEAITRIKTLPGLRLLQYRDVSGKIHPLNTAAINTYLQEVAGVAVTAKDFRTLHASALAAEQLAKLEPGTSETARKRQMAGVTRSVATFLHNTPAICRKSYIAPCLFTLFDKGKLQGLWAEALAPSKAGVKPRETRLGVVLQVAG